MAVLMLGNSRPPLYKPKSVDTSDKTACSGKISVRFPAALRD
jgi:hypothetical protein